MKIKKWNTFINEVSGTELVGPMGPGYGDTKLTNNTIDSSDTDVIYSEFGGRIYTIDEYQQMYEDYLKLNGKPLNGWNKENLEKVISYLKDKQD